MEGTARQEEEVRRRADFAQLYSNFFESHSKEAIAVIDYNLPYPKEEFLKFLVEEKHLLLHGSSNQNLEVLAPQQTNDGAKEFGNKKAVYAVTDSVLPIFYAIRDRTKIRGAIISGYEADAETGEAKYEFRMSREAIEAKPWTRGAVYILDHSSFAQGVNDKGELVDEWAAETAVRPIAKLGVVPEDFRFINEIKPLDEE
ncbi:MAG: hypothetical protein Q8P77_00310 [Candidatus Veblenbacteria bacterium]|nr:hypothetical protein [Candidatus Veblenbacteria bacterium]